MNDDKVFCCELQPRTRIKITTNRDEVLETVVKKIYTLQYYRGKPLPVHDIEIILSEKCSINHKEGKKWFSYNLYLEGRSWVKRIEIIKRGKK